MLSIEVYEKTATIIQPLNNSKVYASTLSLRNAKPYSLSQFSKILEKLRSCSTQTNSPSSVLCEFSLFLARKLFRITHAPTHTHTHASMKKDICVC